MFNAWAFYCVSYPMWSGTALVHDPTFSIFMIQESQQPWGYVVFFAILGAITILAVALYFKKERKGSELKFKDKKKTKK